MPLLPILLSWLLRLINCLLGSVGIDSSEGIGIPPIEGCCDTDPPDDCGGVGRRPLGPEGVGNSPGLGFPGAGFLGSGDCCCLMNWGGGWLKLGLIMEGDGSCCPRCVEYCSN